MLAKDGVHVRFDNHDWALRFSWSSLLALHSLWGENYQERIGNALNRMNLADLAVIVEKMGGPSASEVVSSSPPIAQTVRAMAVAWEWAQNGYEAAATFEAIRAKELAEATKKKHLLSRLLSGFGRHFGTLSPQA